MVPCASLPLGPAPKGVAYPYNPPLLPMPLLCMYSPTLFLHF